MRVGTAWYLFSTMCSCVSAQWESKMAPFFNLPDQQSMTQSSDMGSFGEPGEVVPVRSAELSERSRSPLPSPPPQLLPPSPSTALGMVPRRSESEGTPDEPDDEPDAKRCRRQLRFGSAAGEDDSPPPVKWVWVDGMLCKVDGDHIGDDAQPRDHIGDDAQAAQPRDDFCCSDADGDGPIDAGDDEDNGEESSGDLGRSTPSTSGASSAVGAPPRSLDDVQAPAPHPAPLVDFTHMPGGAAVGPGSRQFTRLVCMRVIDVLGEPFRKNLIKNVCSGMVRREASIFAGCDMYLDLQNQLIEFVTEKYSCVAPMRVHHTLACKKVAYKCDVIAQRKPPPDMIAQKICSLSLKFLSECVVCMCVSILGSMLSFDD